MKKYILTAISALLLLASCGSKEDNPSNTNITGDWGLTGITVKSATLGSETVDVYISFGADKTFKMYQMLGTGRYRFFSGTYSYGGDQLSGKYSDGTSWATTYTVEFNADGTSMTLTGASGGESDTYKKVTIPASVIDNAI